MKKVYLLLIAVLLTAVGVNATHVVVNNKANKNVFANGKNLHLPDIAPPATADVSNKCATHCTTGWSYAPNDANATGWGKTANNATGWNKANATVFSEKAPPTVAVNNATNKSDANKNERNISGSNDNDQGATACSPPVTTIKPESGGTVTAMDKDDGKTVCVFNAKENANVISAGVPTNKVEFNLLM